MNVRKAEAGEILFNEGERNNLLSIIAEGEVSLNSSYATSTIEKGCLLGLCGRESVSYPFTYVASGAVTLYQYDYNGYDDLSTLLYANQDACAVIAYLTTQIVKEQLDVYTGMLSSCQFLYETISEEYKRYKEICAKLNFTPKELPGIDELSDFTSRTQIDNWTIDYYNVIGEYAPAKWKFFYEKDVKACSGHIIKACKDLKNLLPSNKNISVHLDMICDLVLSEYKVDLYTFYLELMEAAIVARAPYDEILEAIEAIIETVENHSPIDRQFAKTRFSEYRGLIPKKHVTDEKESVVEGLDEEMVDKIKDSLRDALDSILEFADIDVKVAYDFKNYVEQYIALSDRSGSDDAARAVRKGITNQFYEIYRKAFFKSLNEAVIPTEVMMFFYFGFVDMELAGEDNSVLLYYLAEQIQADSNGYIFTFYDWLKEIYICHKDPCVNEFNVDYIAYLHKQKVDKKITESEEEKLLVYGVDRVNYEIDNMFKSVNKIISGRVTTFCPVFSDHEFYKPLSSMILTYSNIYKVLNTIRGVDFSLFYREMTYTAPEFGITKELIQVENLPEIILMPGSGTRGAMWQEITGRKRTSSARFALPFFLAEELPKTMVRLCGEFRWELCRRIQGARWNDLGERSLTSDYCDYLETYKRSRDLSPEAKEKIKSSYSKYRNSSKEMFVHDYIDYIMYEAAGSLRLNKLVRPILFTYCPFSKTIRRQVSNGSQFYKELVERYTIKNSHAQHLMDIQMQKLEKAGNGIPTPVREHSEFLKM